MKTKHSRFSNPGKRVPKVATAVSTSQPKKRGRPPKSEQSARQRQPAEEDDISGPSKLSKAGRPRKPGRPAQSQTQPVAEASGGRKRKTREAELEDESEDETVPKKFQRLKQRNRYIPQSVIASKWQAPTPQMQQQILNIFTIAMRPVITSRQDERKRLEAEQVVLAMIRKLKERLPKMPFPPRTKDTDFDLEKVVERNRALENQLTPAMHSIDLLKAQIEAEEAQLQKDQEVLAEFEKNARAEKAALKDLSVKPHHLLRLPRTFKVGGDSAEDIGLVRQKPVDHASFDDTDPDLAPLLDTLRNHLESMQGNYEQVQGIDDAMKEARAALDDVLFTHARPQQYDSIVKL